MKKIVRIGTVPIGTGNRPASVFCKITYADGRLSITGVEGPLANGDAIGSCGQIVMGLNPDTVTPAPGWTKGKIVDFLDIWNKWHLNDMQAGSPAQMAHLDTMTYTGSDHYHWALTQLVAAGLQPDPDYLYKDKPYSYGSAWLLVEVPADVIAFLEALPETDQTPNWV